MILNNNDWKYDLISIVCGLDPMLSTSPDLSIHPYRPLTREVLLPFSDEGKGGAERLNRSPWALTFPPGPRSSPACRLTRRPVLNRTDNNGSARPKQDVCSAQTP